MTVRDSEELLAQWCKYVNNGEMEKLLHLYDDNSILIPTFSESIIYTNEMRQSYFKKLLSRNNLSVILHKRAPIIQKTGEVNEIISGLYYWKYQIEDEDYVFEARYSFVMDITKEKPIQHHHSSQIPRGV